MDNIRSPDTDFLLSLSTRNIPLRMEYRISGMRNSDLTESSTYEIAIIGRSNVGKSSLINFLAGHKNLARVSSRPGHTQTINLFSVEKDQFYMIDLPGYGYARISDEIRQHWQNSMSEFLSEREGLFAALFLVDIRREVEPEDIRLVEWLRSLGIQILVVQTKCDKVHKSALPLIRQKHAQQLGTASGMVVSTSAEKKIGLQNLFAGITGLFESLKPE